MKYVYRSPIIKYFLFIYIICFVTHKPCFFILGQTVEELVMFVHETLLKSGQSVEFLKFSWK